MCLRLFALGLWPTSYQLITDKICALEMVSKCNKPWRADNPRCLGISVAFIPRANSWVKQVTRTNEGWTRWRWWRRRRSLYAARHRPASFHTPSSWRQIFQKAMGQSIVKNKNKQAWNRPWQQYMNVRNDRQHFRLASQKKIETHKQDSKCFTAS